MTDIKIETRQLGVALASKKRGSLCSWRDRGRRREREEKRAENQTKTDRSNGDAKDLRTRAA